MQLLKDVSKSLIDVLRQLPDNFYLQPVSILDQQTIGQQVRHIIEHWQILSDNYDAEFINYSKRKRDKTIETDKEAAINLLIKLQQEYNRNDIPLTIVSLDESSAFSSSYFRELDSVAEHIIHHAAIIKMAIQFIDAHFNMPEKFGYAPSTINFKEQTCAQ